MKMRLLSILIIFLGVIGQGFAEEKITLKQCLHWAYQTNHLLKSSQYQEMQAQMQLKASKAQRLPMVNLLSGYTRIGRLSTIEFSTKPGEPPRKLTFGTPNRMNLNVQLQMPLFTWWRIDNTVRMANLNLQLNALNNEEQKISVTAQVMQAYYSALFAKKMLQLTQQNVERTQKYLKITEKRFEAGQLPKLQLLRAQVQMKSQKSRLQTAKAEYKKSLAFLAKVTGRDLPKVQLQGELTFHPLHLDEQTLFQMALQNRVELKKFNQQKEILTTQQQLAAAANKPNLGLISSFSVQNGFNPMDPEKFYTNYNVGVQLSWPLFDGFSARYQSRSLYYSQMALRERQKEIEANIRLQIRQAIIALHEADEKITAQQANIELAQEALNLAQAQYNQGVISSLDLLDAQRTLLQTEMAYWQAVFNHVLSKIELAKAIGNFSIFENQL